MAKKKIAIVGGGMAALATAFELSQNGLRERFDVTIYQIGWRLGGKGASARDCQGRIVEHGLHIWFGFYENAFRLLRAAYSEWTPNENQAITTCENALRPQRNTSIGAGPSSSIACLEWPIIDGEPGCGNADLSIWSAFSQMYLVMRAFYQQLAALHGEPPKIELSKTILTLLALAKVEVPFAFADRGRAGREREFRFVDVLKVMNEWSASLKENEALRNEPQMRGFATLGRELAESVARWAAADGSPAIRFLSQFIDVGTALIKGVIVDIMLGAATIATLDLMDFREWLTLCGAARDSVYGSPIVKALYDSMFQYCEGDGRRPSYGAGVAAQAIVRLYGTYLNAFAFEMQAGMGEVVVTPIYRVLKQRGVRFEFFYKLENIRLSSDRKSIAALDFQRQALLCKDEYCPTLPPQSQNGYLECWPDHPLWDQLQCGEELSKRNPDFESYWCEEHVDTTPLRQGFHFDEVVLAIPLGAFKPLNAKQGPCRELIAASDRFRAMTEAATLVPSVSVQAWCDRTTAELGWPPGGAFGAAEAAAKPAMSTGPEPLDVAADMSQVLTYEPWQEDGTGPKSLHYFCGVLDTQLFRQPPEASCVPDEGKRLARAKAVCWFESKAQYIWPKSQSNGQFDWTVLFDRSGATGEARIDAQVFHANIDPSGCCVASPAGSTQWRLRTDESEFLHLNLAGAWIDSGFNTECIEAAVISGRQAARAIAKTRGSIPGEDFLVFDQGIVGLIELAVEEAICVFEAAAGTILQTSDGGSVERSFKLRNSRRDKGS